MQGSIFEHWEKKNVSMVREWIIMMYILILLRRPVLISKLCLIRCELLKKKDISLFSFQH